MILGGFALSSSYYYFSNPNKLDEQPASVSKLIFIIYFLLYIFTIIYYLMNNYSRNNVLIFLLTMLFIIIIFQILNKKHTKSQRCMIIFEIILSAALLSATQMFSVNTLIGIDPNFHQWFTEITMNDNSIPTGLWYSSYPLFSLDVLNTLLITNLNYKVGSFLCVGIPQIIIVTLLIILLTKKNYIFHID